MEPNHFLLTEGLVSRWMPFFSLSVRPMDNMRPASTDPKKTSLRSATWACRRPISPSPFPTIRRSTRNISTSKASRRGPGPVEAVFRRFLQELTYKHHKRLVLKSPTHSCRVKTLLELFPDARFVHIVRDPYVVFPSTVNLWKSLYITFGLQRPTFQGLEEHVYKTFDRVYDKIEEGKGLIDFDRFYELRYEDLVRDPVGQMATLYDHLGLVGFEQVLPKLQAHVRTTPAIKPIATSSAMSSGPKSRGGGDR